MPLFGRKSADVPAQTRQEQRAATPPKRNSTLFGRRRSVSPANTSHTTHTTTTTSRSSGSPRRNLLQRHDADPSIVAARERVMGAEAAEREADRALIQARNAVREAREQVKRLEREAAEEARLAQIKQREAANISKRAKPLGRHDHV